MKRRFLLVTFPICLTVIVSVGYFAGAGSLTPPVGPITETMKTLVEVEPRTVINAANTPGDADSSFKIIQPGSYYLTGNFTSPGGRHGIEIAVGGVTLDLNGFELVGTAAGAFDGVSVTVVNLSNIAVINGTVRNWGGTGVDLASFSTRNCHVEGVHASNNLSIGIDVGNGTAVSNCTAANNTAVGIRTGGGCAVTNCSGILNGSGGISAADGSSVLNCAGYQNLHGMIVGAGCSVMNCSATDNTLIGISAGSNGSTISNCTASSNGDVGIATGNGVTVVDCTVESNTLDGIRCTSSCVIRGNTCASNGSGGDGAGIHAQGPGTDNRIEGNNCTGNDRGIDVDVAGNIIFRNMCAGNTSNWDVAAGNVCLVVQAVTGGAILGNFGGASPGASDPIANYTY